MPAAAQNCCVWPEQTVALGGVTEQLGFGFTVSVAPHELLQPLESVIVTL